MSMIIPPASDLEAMAKFFDEYPGWSPVFDNNGVQVGVASPLMSFPGWHGESIYGDGA